MTRKGPKNTSSITLRLFQGAGDSESTFEVVKVSGNPTIPVEEIFPESQEARSEESKQEIETFEGYFPDDGYDYTQHLREIDPRRFIPNTKQPVEEAVDPKNAELAEIMAALNAAESTQFEELDETFTSKLGPVDERTKLAMMWGEDQVDDYLSMPTERLMAIQSRILERESRQIKEESDEAFESFFAREFADSQIGALSSDAVIVDENSHMSFDEEDEEDDDSCDEADEAEEDDPEVIRQECAEHTKRIVAMSEALQQSVLDRDDDMSDVLLVPVSNVPDWDCESVLSTRSNIYNHPGMIMRPKREPKKAPEVAPIQEESEADEIDTPVKSVSTFRKKDETPEERKERKKAIKEFQREQRAAKKTQEKERKEALNSQKKLIAIAKHSNYGDVPVGVPKFAI
jgi:protein LTV1